MSLRKVLIKFRRYVRNLAQIQLKEHKLMTNDGVMSPADRRWLGSVFPPREVKAFAVMNDATATVSFDRMRNMMMRAAEVRESEQQQIFDALDEIHARLAPVESLGSVRKRLSELPDRTEVSVLAERLDEAVLKLESQDGVLSSLGYAVDAIVDKLAKPFAELDGRLDGVSGRFEGVAGRMDGLEDKLAHIHKRLDELGYHLDKQDSKVEALPREIQLPLRERLDTLETVLRGRMDEVGDGMHEHLDGTREALHRSITESSQALSASVDAAREALRGQVEEVRTSLQVKIDEVSAVLDPTERLNALSQRLEQVTGRLDAVEAGLSGKISELSGSVEQVGDTLSARPDADAVKDLVQTAHEQSDRNHARQLDEAMATFAELILGSSASASMPQALPALPRQQQRRVRPNRPATKPTNGKELELSQGATDES